MDAVLGFILIAGGCGAFVVVVALIYAVVIGTATDSRWHNEAGDE